LLLLAQQGHFFNISGETIADKSKANLLAKFLVCLQVLWVAGQAIERKVAGFPISLLEFHTLVHVVCALVMYTLWIRKPYDINEPTIVPTESFPNLLAFIVSSSRWTSNSGFQRLRNGTPIRKIDALRSVFDRSQDPKFYYYGNLRDTPQAWVENFNEREMPIDMNDRRLINHLLRVSKREGDPRWVESTKLITIGPDLPPKLPYYAGNPIKERFGPRNGVEEILALESGQALESGLGPEIQWFASQSNHTNSRGFHVGLSQKDVNRLNMAGNFVRELMTSDHRNSRLQASLNHPSFSNADDPDLNLMPFQPFRAGLLRPYGGRLICRKQSNWIDLEEIFEILDTFGGYGGYYLFALLVMAMILIPAAYGGIHLEAIHSMFPSAIELTLWKASCFTLLGFAALLVLGILGIFGLAGIFSLLGYWERNSNWKIDSWLSKPWVDDFMYLIYFAVFIVSCVVAFAAVLLYIAGRIFIVVESFISLRHVPTGVYQTPDTNFMSYIPHL
jgi:hypothetical protein